MFLCVKYMKIRLARINGKPEKIFLPIEGEDKGSFLCTHTVFLVFKRWPSKADKTMRALRLKPLL